MFATHAFSVSMLFSDIQCVGTVREMLKVHPFEVVEINTANYPTLEVHTLYILVKTYAFKNTQQHPHSCFLKAHLEIEH